MFQVGDKVVNKEYPSLKGTVVEILPAVDDQPELLVIRVWIPPSETGFFFTGIFEEMWHLPEEVSGLTQDAADAPQMREWEVDPRRNGVAQLLVGYCSECGSKLQEDGHCPGEVLKFHPKRRR